MKTWSTDDVAPRESFSYWNDAVCDAFLKVRTERKRDHSFRGTITSAPAGPLFVNQVSSLPHLVRRGRSALGLGAQEWFFLNLHMRGDCVLSQRGRDHHAREGDFTFHDSVEAFDLSFPQDVALTCFIIPRDLLTTRLVNASAAVAQPLPHSGAGMLFRNYARSLATASPSLTEHVREQAAAILVDLLALALGPNEMGQEAGRLSLRRQRFDHACAVIRAALGDPDLSLSAVAGRCFMAPRTLQALFRDHGTTFTDYVLDQRLAIAHRQLRADATATVTEVAYAVGFSDLSYFSRTFRARFGMTASDCRHRAGMRDA